MVVTWGTKRSHGAKVIAFSFGVWYPVNRMCIPTGGDEPTPSGGGDDTPTGGDDTGGDGGIG